LFDDNTGEILEFYTGPDPLSDDVTRHKYAVEGRRVAQGYVRIAYDFRSLTKGMFPDGRLEEVTEVSLAHGSIAPEVSKIFELTKDEMNRRFWELDESLRAALQKKTD